MAEPEPAFCDAIVSGSTRGAENLFGFTQYDGQCEFFGEGAPLPVRILRLGPMISFYTHVPLKHNPLPRALASDSHPAAPRRRIFYGASFLIVLST